MEATAESTAAPVTTLLRPLSVPAIGTLWIEQGGLFAGVIRAPEGDCALIICEDERGHLEDRAWGEYGKEVALCDHHADGRSNTKAMAEAGSQLAKDILALDIAGFNDWYLPAQGELHVAHANLKNHFEQADWYWSSTQYSPDDAWVQNFGDGDSNVSGKYDELRAVAVRRLVL